MRLTTAIGRLKCEVCTQRLMITLRSTAERAMAMREPLVRGLQAEEDDRDDHDDYPSGGDCSDDQPDFSLGAHVPLTCLITSQ